eukprot:COSAG06_NODE_24661_length_656_cov_1.195691_1_plen_194_part_01
MRFLRKRYLRDATERAAAEEAERSAQAAAEAEQLAQQAREAEEQDIATDTGAFEHLVMLKNHVNPPVYAGIFTSGSSLSFQHNGQVITVAGNNRTDGFERAGTLRHDALTTYVLVLVHSVTVGIDAGLAWRAENSLPQVPLTFMALGSLKPAIEASTKPSVTGTLTGAVRIICLVLFGLAINSPLLSIILQSTW